MQGSHARWIRLGVSVTTPSPGHITNFKNLEVAWTFKTEHLGKNPDFNLQATPVMVKGVLYFTAGAHRDAVAVNAATGEMLWMYRLDEGARKSPRVLSGRGVGYWTDGRGDERIFFVTVGYQLIALDAKTGRPIQSFGRNGIIDLREDDDQVMDLMTADVGWNGAPVVARNVVLIGASHSASGRTKANVKGYVRGFDARTGNRLWTFHTIPRPGEFGNDTWLDDSWSYTGNTGVWTQITVDEELGIAYLPCAPLLADVTVNGRTIKVVAQPTKQGFLFVFDRQTGQPVWPIEERAVEKGTVPTEWRLPARRGDRFHACDQGGSAEGAVAIHDRSALHAADHTRIRRQDREAALARSRWLATA